MKPSTRRRQKLALPVFAVVMFAAAFGTYTLFYKINHPHGARVAPPLGSPDDPGVSPDVDVVERHRVPIDGPFRGAVQPKVEIVEFADFKCEYSASEQKVLKKLLAKYQDSVRLSYRYFPDLGDPESVLAANAAAEADVQGKFWEMHDRLFASRTNLKPATIQAIARDLKLDMKRFDAALANRTHQERIDADLLIGASLRMEGTPTFAVNGRLVEGAVAFEHWTGIIDRELVDAETLLSQGVPRSDIYTRLLKRAQQVAAQTRAVPVRPRKGIVHRIDVGTASQIGPAAAPLTLVEFSSYECEACRDIEPVLAKVMETYKDRVRLIWRDAPMGGLDGSAALAARVARAADIQDGKLWQMHILMAREKRVDMAVIEGHARTLGLDVAKLKADMESRRVRLRVQVDAEDAQRFGVGGAPGFFINGVHIEEPTYDGFVKQFEEELKQANRLVAEGTRPIDVYHKITRAGLERSSKVNSDWIAEEDTAIHQVAAGDAPSTGPTDAPATIIYFGAFDCPHTRRLNPLLARLEKEFPGKIRRVWKNLPPEGDPVAMQAAETAMEANSQGLFGPLYDRLFAVKGKLDRAAIEGAAGEAGVDRAKLKGALQKGAWRASIAADVAAAKELDIEGTPTVFINGRVIPGVYPYETFKTVLEQELTNKEIGRVARSQ